MNKIRQFGAVLAISALCVTSTFAESRPRNGSDRRDDRGDWRGGNRGDNRNDRGDNRGDRRNDRGSRNLSAQGRISNLHRERDGYRVQLNRGSQWYYVPSSAWRSHGRRNFDLRVGVSIRLGGGYYGDRGYIHVSDADWYGDDYSYRDGGYNDGYVSGIVQNIDYRRDVAVIRDERTGRHVTVDLGRAERRRGIAVEDLRRGDYVELEGSWVRGNVFSASRIDSLDSRR